MSSEELKMTVSPVVSKEGKRIAYVRFQDDERNAEGILPDCSITTNEGFTDEEIEKLEDYMKANKEQLKKMASGINLMSAFMGNKNDESETTIDSSAD